MRIALSFSNRSVRYQQIDRYTTIYKNTDIDILKKFHILLFCVVFIFRVRFDISSDINLSKSRKYRKKKNVINEYHSLLFHYSIKND
jgi:hypothetical protein